MTAPWLSEVDWQRSEPAPTPFRWGRLGDDYVGEWVGLFAVRASSMGAVKCSWAHPDAPAAQIEKVARGEATAFVRALDGKLSLHASAIAREGQALVLTGPSGAGKSTLASRLCAGFGASLLSDDIAALDMIGTRLRVEPSERVVWLDDGSGAKSPVPMRLESASTDVVLLVLLRFDESLGAPASRRLRGAARVRCLLEAVIRFDPTPELWKRELELLTLLGGQVSLLEVARPRHVSADRVAELLSKLLAESVSARQDA